MLIQGAFMHVNESLSADRFLKHLADEAPGGHYFMAQPPPGIIMTAAIDWRVIVTDGEPVDGLAKALWSGYESMVKPLGGDSLGRPSIFVQIKNVRGESDQFTIGKDVDKKDGLVHRVRESAAILSCKNKESAVKQEMERTISSDYWVKIS
jgi:hypothetical protein